MLASVAVVLALRLSVAFAASGSSDAGHTVSAVFPPAGASFTDTVNFPDATEVGFPGATVTGDEAAAIETAPATSENNDAFPLLRPDTEDKKGSSFNVLRSWGNLSPWYSVPNNLLPDASAQIPEGCSLKQVHLLHRHGARYPTGGSMPAAFATNLSIVANSTGFSASGPLAFLNDWKFKLGAEILTPFGREQMFNLGVGFRVKYGDLLKDFTDLPVFRTTSENRMIESSLHFAAGMFGVSSFQEQYNQLIMIESGGFNNTLAPYDNCNNSNAAVGNFGNPQSAAWANVYTKSAIERLQPHIKGFKLNATTIVAMQQLCSYETVALGYSAFCDLFTEKEWEEYDYFFNVQFWYSNGPGGATVAAQGIGYVQELVSRLTKTTISNFDTSVNSTIVTSPTIFPLDQPIFVDASHDTIMTAIFTALNLTSLAATGPLPTDHIPKKQSYIVSELAPFGSNMVGQVLSCSANAKTNATDATHMRFIINDRVIPLTGIKGCKADKNGLCPLPTLIKGLQQRIAEVDFGFSCFGNITVNPPNLTTGQVPTPKH